MEDGSPEPIDLRFANRLRAIRTSADLSQAELARRVSVGTAQMHQTTIAKIEAGTRRVQLHEAVAVAEALGCTLDDLIATPLEQRVHEVQSELDRALERKRELQRSADHAAAALAAAEAQHAEIEARLSTQRGLVAALTEQLERARREGAADGEHRTTP